MSPSQYQSGTDSKEYRNEAHRMMETKPKRVLLSIRPMTEANAREWLGEANRTGDKELIEHFAAQVRLNVNE